MMKRLYLEFIDGLHEQNIWLYYSIWLFHLHSAVKIQPFSPVFPLAGTTAKVFCRLSLWNFKEKSINHFYNTAFLRADVSQRFSDYGRGAFQTKDILIKRSIVWTCVL